MLLPRRLPDEIPDARSIAHDASLRYVALNREINRTYGAFGRMMQQVVGGESEPPTWYGIAVYASRVAGRSMLAADRALEAVKAVSLGQDVGQALEEAVPGLSEEQALRARDALAGLGLWGAVKLAASFLLAF
ncbi:MAG: hypothetical protein AB1758_20820, partial [Candidatus Eremiobacterota bacterium]